ncbi:hypothetical protein [Olleya sp. Bg11-27]|uniref:hypothetical protein n=1 Tax=Olleya sp. Bg11-27 TaxID=2058135 RepID=UPI000C3062A1|nr:hypothetical protein [Olleya sp. Bg11-27]AUC75891.1 hypothetical protein CW732_09460 [Olleya sp. Bg11-27]
MKILQTILFLFSFSFCFSQQLTKSEFKKLIKESKKEERKSGFSYYSKIIANNKDSIFFKSDKVEIYSSNAVTSEKGFCRTIELKFLNNNNVNFIDCQTCKEPSFCYVSTDKTIYQYRIKETDNELYIFFTNNYNEMNFRIVSSMKNKLNSRNYYKIEMERIK